MLSKSELFKLAHTNAKQYRDYFDSYKFAFSFALTELYAAEKAQTQKEIDMSEQQKSIEQELLDRGCRIWEKEGKRRFYFEIDKEKDLNNLFGITWGHTSRSGWRSEYEIEGEKVSGCYARKYIGKIYSCTGSKFFFDCVSKRWIAVCISSNMKWYNKDITDEIQEFLPECLQDHDAA